MPLLALPLASAYVAPISIWAWLGGHVPNQDGDEVTVFAEQQEQSGLVWATQAEFDLLFQAFTQAVEIVAWRG